MLLADASIRKMLALDCGPHDGSVEGCHLAHRDLKIYPLGQDAVQPASIDIRLGDRMVQQVKTGRPVSVTEPPVFVPKILSLPNYTFILYPGEFYLATTLECFKLGPRTSLKLEGKSSLGRLGLEVHSTAGWVDPGFCGELTLEMKVVGKDPVEIWTGKPIAQVCVFFLDRDADRPYGHPSRNSKYQHQSGPTGTRYRAEVE